MTDLVRTDDVLTSEALMAFLEIDELPTDTIGTCAGEWRRNAHTETWTFWMHGDAD